MPIDRVVPPPQVGALIGALRTRGYRVVGPTRRDGAIVYGDVRSLDDLPVGWGDVQDAGRYELRRRDDDALFGYAVGPHSWKQELFPPRQRLWSAVRDGDAQFTVAEEPHPTEPLAFLGVRACELAAIRIQDRVLLRGLVTDSVYAVRRRNVVLIAATCIEPAATCFCASMGTGPRIGEGADLAVTELIDDGPHELAVEARTDIGAELMAELEGRDAVPQDRDRVETAIARTTDRLQRALDAEGIHDLLLDNLEHPRWDDVGQRCLSCTNCTLVCPTCFCTQVEDVTSLDGSEARRERRWDSCFSLDFSHMGEGNVRTSPESRYRQWMTHKLATWIDQFGTSGCVGCGRCIAWCPVGIDITAEAAAIAAQPAGDDTTRQEPEVAP